jgi:O-6-methylguanine DNA methyltransferase
VAQLAGSPRAYRAVGNILNKNRDLVQVPCHRVVRSDGNLGGYAFGRKKKYILLKKEGALNKKAA